MTAITIPAPSGSLPVHIVQPDRGDGPWPVVVVVHDAIGIADDLFRIARKIAARGYLVAIPDLFSHGHKAVCIPRVFREALTRKGRAFDDLTATREYALGRPDTTDKAGIVGFCLGGQFALLMAPRGFDVSAPFYGVPLPRKLQQTLNGSCPVVASFGARDPLGMGAPARLERALTALGVEHDITTYPGVGHSFANNLAGQPLLRIANFGYDEPVAEQAWLTVLAYLDTHLR